MVRTPKPHEKRTLIRARRVCNGAESRRDHSGREDIAGFHGMTFCTKLFRVNMAALRIADFSCADNRRNRD
jgi:hypothetical protein